MSKNHKQKHKEKEIEIDWIYKLSEGNAFLLWRILQILIPKEDIRNCVLREGHNNKT